MGGRKGLSHEGWCELIGEQSAGEQTISAFCRERGLAQHSFYCHRRRMREEMSSGGFQQISLSQGSGVRLMLDREGWRVEVRRGFDAACLREVVEALR